MTDKPSILEDARQRIKNRARVFVANEPLALDRVNGGLKRYLDLSPAERYGNIVVLLQGRPVLDPAETHATLRKGLNSLSAQDYLLLVGSPCFMVWAAITAADICPEARLLDWDKQYRRYNVLPLTTPWPQQKDTEL